MSSAGSPVIPKEKQSAYQRWELHSFDGAADRRAPGTDRRAGGRRQDEHADNDKVKHVHEHAFQAGLAEGMRRGAQKNAADAERLQALLAGLAGRLTEHEQHVADGVIALALELARQMVRRTLKVRPEAVVPVIQDALARVIQPAQQKTLTLHPEDAALAREHLGAELGAGGWHVVEDPHMARGGCALATAGSQIDASTPTRWRQLAAALGEEGEWLE